MSSMEGSGSVSDPVLTYRQPSRELELENCVYKMCFPETQPGNGRTWQSPHNIRWLNSLSPKFSSRGIFQNRLEVNLRLWSVSWEGKIGCASIENAEYSIIAFQCTYHSARHYLTQHISRATCATSFSITSSFFPRNRKKMSTTQLYISWNGRF